MNEYEERESRPHFKPGAVKYTKGYARKLFVSRVIKLVIFVSAIIIMGLIVIIYINQPVNTGDNYISAIPIRKRTPQHGEHIIIVETEDYNMFSPLKRALVSQNVYHGEIIAGPYGEVKSNNDNFVVIYANRTITVNLQVDPEDSEGRYLDDQYIVRKIDLDGNYIEGEFDKVVTKDEILGLIKKEENIQ